MRVARLRRRVKLLLTFMLAALFLAYHVLDYFVNVNYLAVPRYLVDRLMSRHIPVSELLTEDRSRFYALQAKNADKSSPFLSGFPRYACACEGYDDVNVHQLMPSRKMNSTCSLDASANDVNQNVISYSLFVDTKGGHRVFLEGVGPAIEGMMSLYPDWSIRVYTNIPINNYSCDLICNYPYLSWCDINNIPNLGNLSRLNGRLWRFLPLGDPTVDIFLSRDLDSTGTERERIAVSEWEASDKAIHVMRDSQWHRTQVLAGTFGLKNTHFTRLELNDLQGRLIRDGNKSLDKTWDQNVISRLIYRPFQERVLAHDSYFCDTFKDGAVLPFSTKRIAQAFVGHDGRKEMYRVFTGKLWPCPRKCRPAHGKDWTYC